MINANKRLLKATLTQGVLQIQTNLIQLYSDNLSAIGTQAALIAGFAFSATTASYASDGSDGGDCLSYLYFFFYTICFVCALMVLSQATIVTMFGPSKALKGDSTDAVQMSGDEMRKQQYLVLVGGFFSITALFIGSCIQAWNSLPGLLALTCTFVYLGGYLVLVYAGQGAYEAFRLKRDITTPIGYDPDDGVEDVNTDMKLKVKGFIWKREPLEHGGLFIKRFAVLEKGCIDFYRKESDFSAFENPVNRDPVKLWQYTLEEDPRKFSKSVTSIQNTFKSAVMGNDDFSMSDLMSSEYDLAYAAKHFKFALIPKISSELATVEIIEFLAHNEQTHKQWVQNLRRVIDAYNNVGRLTIEQTMRTGATAVETAVRAANS